ncbi:MAG: CHRD domain-containing protein [Frankia sp.]
MTTKTTIVGNPLRRSRPRVGKCAAVAAILITLTVATGCSGSSSPTAKTAPSTQTSSPAATQKPASQTVDPSASKIPLFLTADLSGAHEVQVAGKPRVGDPNGHATAKVEIQNNKITFSFQWSGISAPTMGHIHEGADGVNGPVRVPFFTTAMPTTATAATGSVTISDSTIANGIRSNPAGYYVNLHTAEFPGGAVRGQLVPAGHPLDMLNGVSLSWKHAFLAGSQEVHVAGKPPVGDPHGHAAAFVRLGASSIDYSFVWVGVTPTLGHIHQGKAGVNGSVVVPLFMTPVPSGVFALSGTVGNVDPGLIEKIRKRPTDFYANLHTAKFPGGAVRGQLF